MALFTQGVLTKKGQALIAKSETKNIGIELTKAVTGSGSHPDTSVSILERLTELITPEQEFGISDLATVDGNNSVAVITVVLHNRGLKKLYYLNELGIYANDPDEGEILYCVLVSSDSLIYMPADNESGGISTVTERIYVEVTNADKITVNAGGAVVSATDFLALRQIVDAVIANLRGGSSGQILVKNSDADYGYIWQDINTVTRPFAQFPAVGRQDAVYIDSDSAEIYLWKRLANGKDGYFKLPLGAEASETLQKQITENGNNIATLNSSMDAVQEMLSEVTIKVPVDNWVESVESGITIYTNEVIVDGMKKSTAGTVYPYIHSTKATDVVEELKAVSVFFGRGVSDSDDGKVILKCYKKCPGVTFGIMIQGISKDEKKVSA